MKSLELHQLFIYTISIYLYLLFLHKYEQNYNNIEKNYELFITLRSCYVKMNLKKIYCKPHFKNNFTDTMI